MVGMLPIDVGLLKALDALQLALLRDLVRQQLSVIETYLELRRFAEAERARYAARLAELVLAREARARPRDWEIMRLARRGWTNSEIAERFGLSAGRVSQIIRRELCPKTSTTRWARRSAPRAVIGVVRTGGTE